MLGRVADGVFDGPVRQDRARAFLNDPSHLIAVAVAEGTVVGMATGVVYLHPDKPPQLWVNEVGTGDDWLRRGVATRTLRALLDEGERRGCRYAWLGTEAGNGPARALYRALGGEETEGIVTFEWGEEAGG